MKKRFLMLAALSLMVAVGGAPLLSHAAEVKTIQLENGGRAVVIQGSGEMYETLEKLGESLQNGINFCPETEVPVPPCPEVPEIPGIGTPDTEAPDTGTPDTETPGAETPDTEMPDTETPGVETPDTEIPDTETPETETPGTEIPDVEIPDTEAPDTEVSGTPEMETPGTETPDDGTSDAAHSYARQVVELVNEERAKAGLPALVMDGVLTRAANVRAKEIKKSFSHTRPDGTGFSSVLKEYGISYRGSGENIAWGQKSPEEVVEGWMNSEGHRANIMNKNFKNIGVGYYQDERGVNYWVQLFTY